jgi:hypothetical protein
MNFESFETQSGFFQDGAGDNVYAPIDFLAENKSGYFYDIFGDLSEGSCEIFNRECVYTRNILEKALITCFIECFKKNDVVKNQQLTYTSVGSGRLFQDLIIITKLLEQGPRNIVINLIDKDYDKFITRAFELGKNDGSFYIDIEKIGNVQGPEDQLNDTFYDFLKWFEFLRIYCYPDLTVKVFVYDDLESYLQDCRNGYNSKSDIGVIIDFHEDFNLREGISGNFDFCRAPFFDYFFENGINSGGIYGFTLLGNLENSQLSTKIGGPIYVSNVPVWGYGVNSKITENFPVTFFCGVKQ